jgi:ribosome modulation factor
MIRFDNPNMDVLLNKHNCVSAAHIAFMHGKTAFLNEDGIDCCPYVEGSVSRTLWERGWRQEFFDNIDVVAAMS